MTATFLPDEEVPPTPDEIKELKQVLQSIRLLKRETGWGVIELSYKGCDLDEITISISKRPKIDYAN